MPFDINVLERYKTEKPRFDPKRLEGYKTEGLRFDPTKLSQIKQEDKPFSISDIPTPIGFTIGQLEKGTKKYLEFEDKYLEPAFKLAVRRPETFIGKVLKPEEIKETEQMRWADILREADTLAQKQFPLLGKLNYVRELLSPRGLKIAKEFVTEMGGAVLEAGIRPSTWITWAALERAVPAAIKGIYKKLPKSIQQALIKERFLFGRSPIDMSYKELGLKPDATWEQVRKAYRSNATRWHPDRAPAGQNIKYTRNFLRKTGAYERLLAEKKVGRSAEKIIKSTVKPTKVTEGVPVIKEPLPIQSKVPTFKSTEDAEAFGKIATSEQAEVMKAKLVDVEAKANVIKAKMKTEEGTTDEEDVEGLRLASEQTYLKEALAQVKPKEGIEPLTEEAKKYKSAEEFVESQKEVLYHQTSKDIEKIIQKEGFSIEFPKARSTDPLIPNGVYFKSTKDNISVGESEESKISQIAVKLPKGNTLEVNDIRELSDKLSEKYNDLLYKEHLHDKNVAQAFDDVEKLSKIELISRVKEMNVDISKVKKNGREEIGIKIAIQKEILRLGKIKSIEQSKEARDLATKELQGMGYDYVHIKNDVGSFGRKTDNYIVLPHKIKEIEQLTQIWQQAQPKGKKDIAFTKKGDAVGKEYHETIYAIDPKTKKKMGYVEHSYLEGKSVVQMIEVYSKYRKQGVGLALLNELQSQSEKPITIMGDIATEEGQALWKKFEAQLTPKVEKVPTEIDKAISQEGDKLKWWEYTPQSELVNIKGYVPITREEFDIIDDAKFKIGGSMFHFGDIIRKETRGAETTGIEGYFIKKGVASIQEDTPANRKAVEVYNEIMSENRGFISKAKKPPTIIKPEKAPLEKLVEPEMKGGEKTLTDLVRNKLASEKGAITIPGEPIVAVESAIDTVANLMTRYRNIDDLTREELVRYEEMIPAEMQESANIAFDMVAKKFNKAQRDAIQLYMDNPAKYPAPEFEGAQELITQINQLQDMLHKAIVEGGYDIGKWPETKIEYLKDKIKKEETRKIYLKTDKALSNASYNIEEMKAEIEKLKGLGYVHRVSRKTLPGIIKGYISGKKISKKPVKFMGRYYDTIDDAKAAGIEVGDLTESVGEIIYETIKLNKTNNLIKAINSNSNYSLPESKAPDDWQKIDSRLFPSGQGKKYHPAMADAIGELTYSGSTRADKILYIYDKINFAGKMIGFYNPIFMTNYDMQQGWRAGGLSFLGNIPKAWKIWHEKGDEYYKLMEAGLFNKILDYKPGASVMVKQLLDQAEKSFGIKFAEKLVDGLTHPIKGLQMFNNKTTWQIDEILRIACRLGIQNKRVAKGLNEFQITDLANDFMAAYNKLPKATKKNLNRAIFTPTYKVSMMRILGKMHRHPKRFTAQLLRHHGYKLFMKFVLPTIIGAYLANEYKDEIVQVFSEKGYRLVIKIGDKTERVYAISGPLLEETKVIHRKPEYTLKLNLAFLPNLMNTVINRSKWKYAEVDDLKRIGEYFKIGAPGIREYLNWSDKDKTSFDKYLSQSGLAYVYTRLPAAKPKDERPTFIKALNAMDLWLEWRESESKRKLLKIEQRYRDYSNKLYKAIKREDKEDEDRLLDSAQKEFGKPFPIRNVYMRIRNERKRLPEMTREEQQLRMKNKFIRGLMKKSTE